MGGLSLAGSVAMKVALGTSLLGATAGVVGAFAVLRRRALVGDMVSHAALPGICVAFLLSQSRNLLVLSLGALGSGVLSIGAVAMITRWSRTKPDAAIGLILSTFFGLGVVLLSIVQRHGAGHQAGLDRYLFGETATIQLSDINVLVLLGIASLAVVACLYKEFQIVSFDPEFSASQGNSVVALDMLLMGLLALVTVVGLPICGVILMSALLILPAAAARYWTNHLGRLLVLASGIGAFSGLCGTLLASGSVEASLGITPLAAGRSGQSLPPGPLIVLSGAGFFLFSMFFAPEKGLFAASRREMRLRFRIIREHLLRSLYELSESQLPVLPWIPESQIADNRGWNHWVLRWQIARANRQGMIEQEDDRVRLTTGGLQQSAQVVRTHRLWELYLVHDAGIAHDHVDRDADDVEHLLPAALLADLENELRNQGRMPEVPDAVPESPHAL